MNKQNVRQRLLLLALCLSLTAWRNELAASNARQPAQDPAASTRSY